MKREDFKVWQAKVNAIIIKRTGFGIDDLPDFDYWSYWNDGVSPSETATKAIQNARDY